MNMICKEVKWPVVNKLTCKYSMLPSHLEMMRVYPLAN